MVGRTQAIERRVENTAGERSGCKTKHCWGFNIATKKWSRTPTLSKLTAGRLHPSSKSGSDLIISCGDLRLVGFTRHRKVVQNPHSRGLVGGPAARWGDVPKVAPEPLPYMVLHAVWLSALRLDGVVFQKVAPELLPCIGDAGQLVFLLLHRGPAARWGGVPKVGVVFQKVAPESPLCILLLLRQLDVRFAWKIPSSYIHYVQIHYLGNKEIKIKTKILKQT